MKKRIVLLAAAAGVLLLLPSLTFGAAQPFESTLTDSNGQPGDPYVRYYTPVNDKINPSRTSNCLTGFGPDGVSCLATYRAKRRAHRAYSENIFNYDGAEGNMYHAVWDMQLDAGTSNHTGYYAWACDPVTLADTYLWRAVDCTGTISGRCLGPLNPASGVGSDLTNVPQSRDGVNTIAHIEAMRPIPVPRVDNYDKVTGDITLSWDPAGHVGTCTDAAQYLLYFADRPAVAGGDPPPAETAFQPVNQGAGAGPLVGTTVTVNVADFGHAPGDENVLTFALKLKFPNAGVNAVESQFLSANGQDVYIGAGGLGSEITDIAVKPVGRSAVEITWRTSLEDSLSGFYVGRSLAASGPFEKVSDLIPANGEPSSYSYIDQLANTRGARVMPGADGLYYTVISVNADGSEEQSQPVQLQLPGVPNDRPIRMRPRR